MQGERSEPVCAMPMIGFPERSSPGVRPKLTQVALEIKGRHPGLSGLSNHCRDRKGRLPPPVRPAIRFASWIYRPSLSFASLAHVPYVAPALSRHYEPYRAANSMFRLRGPICVSLAQLPDGRLTSRAATLRTARGAGRRSATHKPPTQRRRRRPRRRAQAPGR